MEHLEQAGHFTPPSLTALETVLEAGLRMNRGRVFADTWDLEPFYPCPACGPLRRDRLVLMNLTQKPVPPVACACGTA